jgi:hypothetical protein
LFLNTIFTLPADKGGGNKSYVNDKGDESGDWSGPLHEANALKYTVPLTKEVVTGIRFPIEAENTSEVPKLGSFDIEAVIAKGSFDPI